MIKSVMTCNLNNPILV